MNIRIIAAAIAAMSATTAFAQGTFIPPAKYDAKKDPCVAGQTGTGAITKAQADAAMPLYCRPEITFYIAGASAPAAAVTLAVPPAVFEGAPFRITATSGSEVHGLNSAVIGWYGYGKAGTSFAGKRVYVGYNNKNGSAAGVAQLVTTTANEEEAKMVVPGDNGTCTAVNGGSAIPATGSTVAYAGGYTCAATVKLEAALAFSDVLPWELDHATLRAANATKMPDTYSGKLLKSVPLALQGFGVAVNLPLYKALQKRDIAAGRLASTCQDNVDQTSVGALCRPNLSSLDYASLVSAGGVTTASKWLGDPSDVTKITLQRRVASSGTQAASNLHFLRTNCQGYGKDLTGTVQTNEVQKNVSVNMAGAPVKISYGGAMAPRGAGVYGDLTVVEQGETSGVRDRIRDDTAGYSIGVVSLENTESKFGTNGRFVRLDGADPLLTSNAALDTSARVNLTNGRWPFAVEFQAVHRAAASKVVGFDAVRDAVIAGVKGGDTALVGLAYFPGNNVGLTTADPLSKVTLVKRAGGNNCAPLVRIN